MMRFKKHKELDWANVPQGQKLIKFDACDEGNSSGDYAVRIHGLIDENGNVYIVQEDVNYPNR